ncbi:MAG: AraC family transcriptional regulator [Actinobacteria bacterium]|nr:AraC family transcriptional regulator [Actinomycetota bacterium]
MQHAVASLRVADHRIDRLADRTGLSARQLQRRFVRHVGYPPSRFARVARLQRFLHLATLESDEHLADLAARSGYADQSHLVRECRSITGLTPSRLRSIAPATSYAPTRVDDGVRSVQAEHRRGARRSAA